MIRYALRCPDNHRFESWFQNAAAFDALRDGGQLTCAICGAAGVEKAPMAPTLATDATGPARTGGTHPLARLKREIEARSDYVGRDFARQARAMHEGDMPERMIHGETRLDEVRTLVEDGVPVAPLPFRPAAKSN